MELKAEYRKTEVGVIPDDWLLVELRDCLVIKSGLAFSSAHFSDKGPILLTPGNFKLSGGLIFIERNTKRYGGMYPASAVFEHGDLLIVMTDLTPDCNLLGKPAFVDRHEPILHNQRIGKIQLSSKKVSKAFLYWYFLSDAHAARMKNTATGSTVRHTSNKSIYESKIALPPTEAEQQAISEVLSDADALIESLDQLISKKRQVKQGAMQELLTGKRRLPGFSGEWEVRRIGELADMGSGGTPPSSNPSFYDGEIPWVAISDMTKGGKFITYTERNLSNEGLSNCAAQMFPVGTVLYAMYASLGECSIASVPLSSSQAILGIRVKEKLSGEFLYYYLQSIKPKVKTLGQQGTQANLNKGMVQDFSLQLPPVIEQTAIATVLSDMDTELAALESRLAKARQIKQGMMQELLTGRIRLL